MKISFSLRAFVVYFLILGSLLWFTLDNAIERLKDCMRQSAESVRVDIAHIIASVIEKDLDAQPATVSPTTIPTDTLKTLFTDTNGIVVYDSSGIALGKNISQWHDVHLTLKESINTVLVPALKTQIKLHRMMSR